MYDVSSNQILRPSSGGQLRSAITFTLFGALTGMRYGLGEQNSSICRVPSSKLFQIKFLISLQNNKFPEVFSFVLVNPFSIPYPPKVPLLGLDTSPREVQVLSG